MKNFLIIIFLQLYLIETYLLNILKSYNKKIIFNSFKNDFLYDITSKKINYTNSVLPYNSNIKNKSQELDIINILKTSKYDLNYNKNIKEYNINESKNLSHISIRRKKTQRINDNNNILPPFNNFYYNKDFKINNIQNVKNVSINEKIDNSNLTNNLFNKKIFTKNSNCIIENISTNLIINEIEDVSTINEIVTYTFYGKIFNTIEYKISLEGSFVKFSDINVISSDIELIEAYEINNCYNNSDLINTSFNINDNTNKQINSNYICIISKFKPIDTNFKPITIRILYSYKSRNSILKKYIINGNNKDYLSLANNNNTNKNKNNLIYNNNIPNEEFMIIWAYDLTNLYYLVKSINIKFSIYLKNMFFENLISYFPKNNANVRSIIF